MAVFDSSGSVTDFGSEAYKVIDPAVAAIFKDLIEKGYTVNDIFTLVTLSAADARTNIVLDNRYKTSIS